MDQPFNPTIPPLVPAENHWKCGLPFPPNSKAWQTCSSSNCSPKEEKLSPSLPEVSLFVSLKRHHWSSKRIFRPSTLVGEYCFLGSSELWATPVSWCVQNRLLSSAFFHPFLNRAFRWLQEGILRGFSFLINSCLCFDWWEVGIPMLGMKGRTCDVPDKSCWSTLLGLVFELCCSVRCSISKQALRWMFDFSSWCNMKKINHCWCTKCGGFWKC